LEIIGHQSDIKALKKIRERHAKFGIISKEELISGLKLICEFELVENTRSKNDGAVGNVIEDLLGIAENNLPIPNAAEWELKGQRIGTTSLISLFHLDPSPRSVSLVSKLLLPNYGWPHKKAGSGHPSGEMSFRQTLKANTRTDRGFGVSVDYENRKVVISFDVNYVSERNNKWKSSVEERIGLGELDPQPFWGFDDLFHKAGTKLHNCFFVLAKPERRNEKMYFKYSSVLMLERFSLDKFIRAIEQGEVYIDFDARTGHNHGTKFRLRRERLPDLYDNVTQLI
jgi:hypothetical protein